jgi:hypothetical protein
MTSLPLDFYIKTLSKTTLYASDIPKLPIPSPIDAGMWIYAEICKRAACLNSVSHHFADLARFSFEKFGRLVSTPLTNLDQSRSEEDPIHPLSDLERRNLLIEIDVLCALALGLGIDELISLYIVQFPVARQYEKQTFYDKKGSIVFTVSKGLAGVGLPRRAKGRGTNKELDWEGIREETSGLFNHRTVDDTFPGEPEVLTVVYEAPFKFYDRVADYKTAWAFFEKHGIGS